MRIRPLRRPTQNAAALAALGARSVESLLRCVWGEVVWDKRYPQPERCRNDATSIVCVHREDGAEKELRLCTEHRAFIDTQTTPRAEQNG